MKKLWVVPVLISLAFILLPDHASAGMFDPIIHPDCYCPQSAPDWGCVMQTMQNIVNLMISLGVIIATIAIAWAGGLWMTSPLNAQNRERGRTMLLNAVIGLVIVLIAWIFVDFLMKSLYNESATSGDVSLGPWNQIIENKLGPGARCIKVKEALPPPPTGGGVEVTDPTDPTDSEPDGPAEPPAQGQSPQGCSNCRLVANVAHKTAAQNGCYLSGGRDGVQTFSPPLQGCYLNSGLLTSLQSAVRTDRGWQVTEMWPPTQNHGEPCHANGTCADVARSSGPPSSSQLNLVSEMANNLRNQGLYVVWEDGSLSRAQCEEILNGISNPGAQVKVMKIGSQPHFSVYVSDEQSGSGCIGF